MGNLQEEDEEVSDESKSENVSGGKDEGEIEDDDMYEEIDIWFQNKIFLIINPIF